jgi:transcriptional regulator with XRE-family HTH domain
VANLPFRDLRAKIGLTQAELASRLCTSRRTVENWDSGQRSCSPTIRILFAESFGLLDVRMLLILLDTGAED